MGRSKLLIDLVSKNVDLENILLRMKVILTDLDDKNIMNWINGELEGYSAEDDLPHYRILQGVALGTFIINRGTKYTDHQVPLEFLLNNDEIKEINSVFIDDSIRAVQLILNGENRDNYAKQIPTSYCHSISKLDLQIAGMRVVIPSNKIESIVSHVKSKLVDILMELEKRFENLDELDIKEQVESDPTKKELVTINIEKIIYEGSIDIGDNNKIKKSGIGRLFGGN